MTFTHIYVYTTVMHKNSFVLYSSTIVPGRGLDPLTKTRKVILHSFPDCKFAAVLRLQNSSAILQACLTLHKFLER
jgi:hypothetical protein